MKHKFQFLTMLLALVFAILACNLGSNLPAVPTALPSALPSALPQIPTPDPSTVEDLETEVENALEEATTTGKLTITVTEGQLTEFINRKNAENANSTFSNLQVFLRDGQIQLIGTAETDAGSATFEAFLTVSVTSKGTLEFAVTSGKIGLLPLPGPMLEGISQSINETLNSPDAQLADKIFIESVEIGEGFLTLTGTMK